MEKKKNTAQNERARDENPTNDHEATDIRKPSLCHAEDC